MESVKKRPGVKIAFYLVVFIGLMLFFTCDHPLYIYDVDDWTYVSSPRLAVPQPFMWNPTRILPEIMMPFFAQIGVSCIYPFLQDYIQSLAVAFAVALSGMIVFYLAGMDYLLQKSYRMRNERYLLILTLLLWHFLPFCVAGEKSPHMFYAANVTCVFYYIISGLLNAGAALLVMGGLRPAEKKNARFNGLLLLGVYLCINSNMYQSIILATAASAELFCSWIGVMKQSGCRFWKSIGQTIRENRAKTAVVCLWLLSLVLEMTGGRAQAASDASGLGVKNALQQFAQSIARLNLIWLAGTIGLILIALLVCVASKRHPGNAETAKLNALYLHQMAVCSLCLVVSIVYLILLSARVNPEYLQSSAVEFSWVIWCFFMLMISMAYLLKRIPRTESLLPLVLCVAISVTVIDGEIYADSNAVPQYDIQTVKALDESIIRQAQEAEKEGKTVVEIRIPKTDSENWPLTVDWGGERIQRTLYRHGLTHTQLEIHLVMDEAINEEFHLNDEG